MKTFVPTLKKLIILPLLILLMGYSPNDEIYIEPFSYKPVLMTRANLENSIEVLPARELKKTGKIYMKDHYIFISERYEGVHVINNTDPENPVNSSFIRVPGCLDLAAKGNVLYVDNAVDLIAIDISDLSNMKIKSRVKDIFPEIPPPNQQYIPYQFQSLNRPENTVIINWVKNEDKL